MALRELNIKFQIHRIMFKQSKLKVSLLLLVPFLMLGCFEDHPSMFHLDDINQLEWAPPNRNSASLSATITVPADETETITRTFTVQLIGAHAGSDRTGGVAVASTTANEGVHFELGSSEVVIPANSSFGEVDVIIHSENLANGDSYTATLELLPGTVLGVAENMKNLNLTIRKAAN
jgi:hypothetical protein